METKILIRYQLISNRGDVPDKGTPSEKSEHHSDTLLRHLTKWVKYQQWEPQILSTSAMIGSASPTLEKEPGQIKIACVKRLTVFNKPITFLLHIDINYSTR